MQEDRLTAIMNDIRHVLAFSSTMMVRALHQEFSADGADWDAVRGACQRLAESGMYPFDLSVSNAELYQQIHDFTNSALDQ